MSDDDSGVTARLVVSLEARLTRFEKALQRAEALADGSMGAIEKRAKKAEERLKESIGQINLEHQLDVARAQGNSKVVEKLSEELALRKQIGRLTSAGLSQEEARALAEKQIAAQTAAQKLNEGFSGALRGVVGRARFGVLEEGGARIPLFGSQLEKLGVAGVAAGAGVLIAAEAMERAEKAAEWAESLEKVAAKLGITTTALQELDFVALKAGVSQETLREGMQKVEQAIGSYTSNVKDGKLKTVFEALGISKDAAREFEGPVDGMAKIADAVGKIKDRSQQLALLKDLKVPDDMVPLLLQGGDAIRRQAIEAHRAGVVLDEEMVKKGAEFAEKLKVSRDIIAHDMMRAFIALAPVVSKIVGLMERMASLAADTAEDLMHGRLDPNAHGEEKLSEAHLRDIVRDTGADMSRFAGSKARSNRDGFNTAGADLVGAHAFDMARAAHDRAQAEIDRRDAERKKEDKDSKPAAAALVDEKTPKERRPPEDRTAALDKTATDAADTAARELAAAQLGLASSIEERARLQRAELAVGTDKRLADLSKEEADVAKAGVDAHRVAQRKLLERAKSETLLAADAKAELIKREAAVAASKDLAETAAQASAIRQEGLKLVEDYNTAMAGLATTMAERTRFERAALSAAQARETEAARAAVAAATSALDQAIQAGKSPSELGRLGRDVTAAQARLGSVPQMQGLQTKAFDNQHLTPWDQWLKDGRAAAAGVHEALEKEAVKGIDDFNSGLADAIVNGKSLGSTLSSIFKQMEGDLVRYLLKQGEIGLFGGGQAGGQDGGSGVLGSLFGAAASAFLGVPVLPGHATGADSFGGATKINERGTEGVAFLPPNTQIIPNDTLRGLARLDPSKMGRGGGSVTHDIRINLEGANGDDAIRRIAYQAASEGSRYAIATSGEQMRSALGRASFEQTWNG